MESPVLQLVNQFLEGLESIQTELIDLFEIKRRALVQGDVDDIHRLNGRERECAVRLQGLLAFRNRILSKIREQEPAIQSLEELALRFQHLPGWDRVLERIRSSNRTQGRIRQASWTHWIISHRCYNHYTEILDLIAHQGEKEAAYSQVSHQTVRGGTMLDASI